MRAFVHPFKSQMISLSNAPHNGGVFRANGFFFMQVHRNYDGDYKKDCLEFERANGLKNFVGFMTAADIEKVLSIAESGNVRAYITAGITNPAIAGDEPPRFLSKTINIALVIKEGLTLGAMANAIMTATEAKTYTLLDLGYNATGTTSDGIGVFAFEGEQEWAGTATRLGIDIGRAVRKALKESLKKWEKTKDSL
ncbi:MAG: adenosylcobinamide hydrolase [Thermococcaceae archaeon]|nr:MAG: Adenosylcobinamide amidohydrolase [Thermococcales archaeon 44_46]MDK2782796.1 adenosylcobinamide hydrolase [Thermococcaceae archaeon]MDK2982934.1 adenosylcobinamide hydrolase [Thermococcaceae archaeon]MDN5319686.1 adenosylcobinamide hydrolase [Thermococcaceae archaeon]HIH71945.1 adenosylcobinamide amidohydrolase [Thermococcaceae archaeon]